MILTPHNRHAVLRGELNLFLARSFRSAHPGKSFTLSLVPRAIVHVLEQCRTGKITRLIITLPPRHLKSFTTSVVFPAYVLGLDPTKQFICASYGQDLAGKHHHDTRKLMNESWYRSQFPNLRLVKDTKEEFETTLNGSRLATSVGGVLTGRGCDFAIFDDTLKVSEANSKTAREAVISFFSDSLFTRLNDKATGVIIVVMQRLHEDDLAGHLLRQGGWYHLNLPAIAEIEENIPIGYGQFHLRKVGDVLDPVREPKAVLDQTQRTLGINSFRSQYQQDPLPPYGNILKKDWLRTYTNLPPRNNGSIIQSWDTAHKDGKANDYSVCMTWLLQGSSIYLVDVFRRRCDFPTLVKIARELYVKYQPDTVLIEEQGSGLSLLPELKRPGIKSIPRRPAGNKESRFSGVMPAFERGDVLFPAEADFLAILLQEILAFPGSRHDDQVDSISQCLVWVRERLQSSAFDVFWA